MALRTVLLALAAAASLVACGSRAEDPALDAARGFVRELLDRATPDAPAPSLDLRAVFTRDLINQAATPLTYVEIDTINAQAIIWRIATNGSNETWRGEDELSLTLSREGVLRATRGFIYDLHASDIEGTRAALAAHRAGRVQRLHVHLGGDLEQMQTGYTCDIGFAAPEAINIFGEVRRLTPATERCIDSASGEAFENRYWIDAGGFVWVSDQWAGPELGTLHIERLYR